MNRTILASSAVQTQRIQTRFLAPAAFAQDGGQGLAVERSVVGAGGDLETGGVAPAPLVADLLDPFLHSTTIRFELETSQAGN